ncbi:uncharacterized protein PAC_18340 [Phialocephala subalpina]|uniref:Uncharacterized protein n=1 Tax=Phialocephala subalpina TaxID=576137 RepID=A0A1L7XTS1_9HELO|nr:uncharacterized protein PAC_18340 [Phialocephala subalpina]
MSTVVGVGAVNLAHKDGYADIPIDKEANSSPVLRVGNVNGHEEFADLLASDEANTTTTSIEVNSGHHEDPASVTMDNEANTNPASMPENGNADEIPQTLPRTELEPIEAQPVIPEPPPADFPQGE